MLARQFRHCPRVLRRNGKRFVHERRFAKGRDLAEKIEVSASVHRRQQKGVASLSDGGGRVEDFDAVFIADFGGETLHAVARQSENVGAASKGSHGAPAFDVKRIADIVEQAGESGNVRGIEANKANLQLIHSCWLKFQFTAIFASVLVPLSSSVRRIVQVPAASLSAGDNFCVSVQSGPTVAP